MKYILANNASATLSALLTVAATSATLANVSTTLATALGQVDASHRILLTLADMAESAHEVVEVTAWNSGTSTATITRAQDGTTAAEWAVVGSKVEVRVGKQQLESLNNGQGLYSVNIGRNSYASHESGIAIGDSANCQGENAINIGDGYVNTPKGIAIGHGADVNSSGLGTGIAMGKSCKVYAGALADEDGVAVGIGASAYIKAIALGLGAEAGNPKSISIGDAGVWSDDAIVLGFGYAGGGDSGSVIIGNETFPAGGGSPDGVFIGRGVNAGGAESSIGIGNGAVLYASLAAAIGAGALCEVTTGAHLAMIPYQPKAAALPDPLPHGGDIATRHRAAPMMTLATGIINLADNTSAYEVEIPSGVRFFADRIDVIIAAATSPAGAPAITVGTTAGGTDILAATAITKTAAHQRQQIAPDNADGVTSIHVKTSTAGTGTLTCRVVLVGYLVADE